MFLNIFLKLILVEYTPKFGKGESPSTCRSLFSYKIGAGGDIDLNNLEIVIHH